MLQHSQLIITSAFGLRYKAPTAFLKSALNVGLNCPILVIRHQSDNAFLKTCQKIYPNTHVVSSLRYLPLMPLCKISARFKELSRLIALIHFHLIRKLSIEDRVREILHFSSSRYLVALQLITSSSYMYADQILLTDSRDVIFQRNPFEGIEDKLITGEESSVISEEIWNKNCLDFVYGSEVAIHESLSSQSIICSGVTLGTRNRIIDYLEHMRQEFIRKSMQIAYLPGLDQIIHNKVLREHSPEKIQLCQNGGDMIANLATENLNTFHKILDKGLLTKNNKLVSIVHQYDRHPLLHYLANIA